MREGGSRPPFGRPLWPLGLVFGLTAIILNVLVAYLMGNGHLAFIPDLTARAITALVQASGLHAVREGLVIHLTNSTWEVAIECTAVFIMLIYASFVLVYPASVRAKLAALLAGIPFIFCANILRLYAMAWIDYLMPGYSAAFHSYVWQVAFILMVVMMWLGWIAHLGDDESKAPLSR